MKKLKLAGAFTLLCLAAVNAVADTLDSGDTAWMLTSTALVLFMTLPGLALFYAGLVRGRNVLSVLMQCFAIACMVSVLWVIAGYSLFATDGGGLQSLIGGTGKFLLAGVTTDSVEGTMPETVFVMFQMTFAIITPALIVGGFAERMRFSAMLWFSALWLFLVYLPVAHWVWGGGWLAEAWIHGFRRRRGRARECRNCRHSGRRFDDWVIDRGFPSSGQCRRTVCRLP